MKICIDELKKLCSDDKIKWTLHALKRLRERKIPVHAAVEAILCGEAINQYHDDKPFPSYLIFNGNDNEPLHVVVSTDGDAVYIITAYVPDLDEWEADYKTRKGRK